MIHLSKESFTERTATNKTDFSSRLASSKFKDRSGLFLVNFYNGIESVQESQNLHFTNKILNSKLNTPINSIILNVLKCNNKIIKLIDSDFDDESKNNPVKKLDFSDSVNGKRISQIFSLYNLPLLDDYYRISLTSKAKAMYGNQNGEIPRMVYYIDFPNRVITVIIIDPHHLLATYNPSKDFTNINNKNKTCLKELYDNYMDLY